MQRGEFPQINCIHVGIVLDKQLCHLIVAVRTGIVQRNKTTDSCVHVYVNMNIQLCTCMVMG